MEKREYGKTGEMLSVIGFGGIVVTGEDQRDATNYVAEAYDRGINYYDVAPYYGDAEVKLGPALAGKRNHVFLACKTEKRTAPEAEEALHRSLEYLKTGHFDLYQLHAVTTLEEVQTILAPGGALETLIKAREKGYVKYLGFSAHSDEAAVALLDQFAFDSVLFPVNWASMMIHGFGKPTMKKAMEKGAARLALKAMANGYWPEGSDRKYGKCWYQPIDDPKLANLALRYTLSQPVTAAIPPGDIRLFRWALEAAEETLVLSTEEEAFLKEQSRNLNALFPVKE